MKERKAKSPRPILALSALAVVAFAMFALKSEPSAARPMLARTPASYRATSLQGWLLFAEAPRGRVASSEARPQSTVTFTTPRLLLTTPKRSDVPAADVETLSIETVFRTQRVVAYAPPIVRFDPALRPGTKKIARKGTPKIVALTERVTFWNALAVDRQVVTRTVVEHAVPAVIVAAPPRNVKEAMALTGAHKLVAVYSMVATAYTADSAQAVPTGRTATGLPAHYGVVAVDPRVIPLGAHLYIEGYGTAIAADTGSAIVGNRIDLCMDSYRQAIDWGRQPVRVYVLRNR